MKSKTEKKVISMEEEYKEIVNDFDSSKLYQVREVPEWMNNHDLFVKFSLYSEKPNSISSTDTLMVSSLNI